MSRDLATHDALASRHLRPAALLEKVSDTDVALGSVAMAAALRCYGQFKLAARASGLDALRRDLGRRFGKTASKGPETGTDIAAEARCPLRHSPVVTAKRLAKGGLSVGTGLDPTGERRGGYAFDPKAVAAIGGTGRVNVAGGTVEVTGVDDAITEQHAIEAAGYTVAAKPVITASAGC